MTRRNFFSLLGLGMPATTAAAMSTPSVPAKVWTCKTPGLYPDGEGSGRRTALYWHGEKMATAVVAACPAEGWFDVRWPRPRNFVYPKVPLPDLRSREHHLTDVETGRMFTRHYGPYELRDLITGNIVAVSRGG